MYKYTNIRTGRYKIKGVISMNFLIAVLTIASLTLGLLALMYKLLYFAISKTIREDICSKSHSEMASKGDLINMKNVNDMQYNFFEESLREIKEALKEINQKLNTK